MSNFPFCSPADCRMAAVGQAKDDSVPWNRPHCSCRVQQAVSCLQVRVHECSLQGPCSSCMQKAHQALKSLQ